MATTIDVGIEFDVIGKETDLLKVRISAWNGAFGGAADVYTGIGGLEEAAKRLKGFPQHPADTREVTLGAFGPEWAGGGVRMRFYCLDASGHAHLELDIESEGLQGRPSQSVHMSLAIEAASVDSFIEELRSTGARTRGSARLEGMPAETPL
ncbi:MAG TPA: hypothetical protein VFL79_20245 [Terriglobia bacterium]|nr:hypothetical protein [Terriglobia bacterium]